MKIRGSKGGGGDMPVVSVITTVYNGRDFIGEAIKSILGQAYNSLEYLIVDDGSTDGTKNVIQSFHDSRIRLFSPGRIGRGKALNLALGETQGEYVAIQDADDVSHPERLTMEVHALRRLGRDVALGSAAIPILGGETLDVGTLPHLNETDVELQDVTDRAMFFNPVIHSSILIARQALMDIGGYNEARKDLFDWEMLLRHVLSGGRLVTMSAPLVLRRFHNGQFFERDHRLSYVLSTVRLQYSAMRRSGRHCGVLLLLLFMAGYRLMPFRLRMLFRTLLSTHLSCGARAFGVKGDPYRCRGDLGWEMQKPS